MPSTSEFNQNTGTQGNKTTAPSISLPTGAGAIRRLGDKFAANPVTDTGSMTVPIATNPGRSGFGPQVSLSYDSGAGNGPFGFGWSLSLPAITRKTDKGLPRYFDAEESDVFILSGAEDLVPVLLQDAQGDWQPENIVNVFRSFIQTCWIKIHHQKIIFEKGELERREKLGVFRSGVVKCA